MSINAANALGLDASLTLDAQVAGGAKIKEKQLVSEIGDQNEDNKDDTSLQVPLMSRNDAVYMGTIWMGSPVS